MWPWRMWGHRIASLCGWIRNQHIGKPQGKITGNNQYNYSFLLIFKHRSTVSSYGRQKSCGPRRGIPFPTGATCRSSTTYIWSKTNWVAIWCLWTLHWVVFLNYILSNIHFVFVTTFYLIFIIIYCTVFYLLFISFL